MSNSNNTQTILNSTSPSRRLNRKTRSPLCNHVWSLFRPGFVARDSIYAKRAYAIAIPYVRLSVCLSYGWNNQKRLKLGSCNFQHPLCNHVWSLFRPGFVARDSIYAKRAYAIAIPSVRLSVCLSYGWNNQKRLKLGSCNFQHTVAPSL